MALDESALLCSEVRWVDQGDHFSRPANTVVGELLTPPDNTVQNISHAAVAI